MGMFDWEGGLIPVAQWGKSNKIFQTPNIIYLHVFFLLAIYDHNCGTPDS